MNIEIIMTKMDKIDFLTIVYEDYCTKHSLPYVSADEQDLSYLDEEECDHEGYVMWNKYGAFKIVNRAVFSSANFRLSKNR